MRLSVISPVTNDGGNFMTEERTTGIGVVNAIVTNQCFAAVPFNKRMKIVHHDPVV
jgi:hypothetical protein